jgi:RNA-directed DNA polymerase
MAGTVRLPAGLHKLWQRERIPVKAELKHLMHDPIPTVSNYLRAVVLRHVRYRGVPMNGPAISAFRYLVGRALWLGLRRRSQGNHLPWRRM